MLQNPSKFHPNPFSHFLAIHSSQAAAAHNAIAHHPQLVAMPPMAAAAAAGAQSQFQQQQQQHQQHNYGNSHHAAGVTTNQQQSHPFQLQTQQQRQVTQPQQQQQQQHNPQSHHHPQHQQRAHLHSPHTQAQQLIDAANTSLDVGKSFTIAAILGLQKSALESSSRKEYNNAINLSLNGSGVAVGSEGSNSSLLGVVGRAVAASDGSQLHSSGDEMDKTEQQPLCNTNNSNNKTVVGGHKQTACNNNNNNSIKNNNSHNAFRVVSNFNCDNGAGAAAALMQRYLPVAAAAVTVTAPAPTSVATAGNAFMTAQHQHQQQQQHQPQHHHHQQQQQHQLLSHVRAVASAAAASAAAVASGAPSALQSLQQLHQHHAQQSTLAFQRDKHKSESSAKKSALKNKRVRTIFTPEQLERLEAEFERQQYMVGPERLYLAHTLQLTEAQVKVWFQNRRIKWRKHHLEVTQQRLALLRQSQLPTTQPGNAIAVAAAAATAAAVAAASNSTTNNAADTTRSSSPLSCGAEEIDEMIKQSDDLRPLSISSRPATESDLSVCNDSIDAGSLLDGGEDT